MKKLFNILKTVIVIAIVIYACNKAFTYYTHKVGTEFLMERAAKKDILTSVGIMAKELPILVDENTTIVKMEYLELDNVLSFTYKLNNISRSELDSKIPNLKREFISLIRNDSGNEQAIKAETTFDYIYLDIDDNQMERFQIYPKDYLSR